MAVLLSMPLTQAGCGKGNLSSLHDTLNKTAKALEAAIDTNGRLYQGGIYGVVGSAPAIAVRQRAATVIFNSNEALIKALNLAKGLTEQTFEQGKLGVLQALTTAASGLVVGNQTIDLVLQSVVALINQAVAIVQLFQSSVIRDLQYAAPVIRTHIQEFQRLKEAA